MVAAAQRQLFSVNNANSYITGCLAKNAVKKPFVFLVYMTDLKQLFIHTTNSELGQ